MKPELPETIYTPESQLLKPLKLLGAMFADIRASRFLAWRLFVRNLSAQHRQTMLGYFWMLLGPVAQTLLWVFLNSQKVINVGHTDIPYPAFVLTGSLLWQGFVDALNCPMQQIMAARQMLTKIRFPHEAIILSGLGMVLVNLGIRLLLVVGVFVWFGLPLGWSLLLAPVGIVVLIGFGLALGLLLTPLALLYRDMQRILSMGVSIGFFITPVIYPTPTTGWAALVTKLNPVTPLLVTTRQWLTGGHASQLTPFLVVAAATLVIGLFGWVQYRLAIPHLIERIGS